MTHNTFPVAEPITRSAPHLADIPTSDSDRRFDAQPSVSNHFAWIRTRLSVERTFMAWLRTAVSLIGFGFTIVQFFQRLQQMDPGAGHPVRPEAPRDLGLALIGAGLGSLVISAWQYRQGLKYLWQDQFKSIAGVYEKPQRTPLFMASMVLTLIGIFAFGSVFFHIM
jgi:putative membrane protein